jgi:thiosulfate/3-mercaptopyruvate sulfurtransferase
MESRRWGLGGLRLDATHLTDMRTIIFSLLVVFAATASAQALLERPGLVSTNWLAQHLDHPDLRVIDARASLRPYMPAHLPGAIYLNTETVRFSEGGVPARLFPAEQLAEMLGKMGIGNDHTVVIYSSGEEAFAHAAYVAYLLEWLGHKAVAVLDGGIEKWEAEGRQVTTAFPNHEPVRFSARVKEELLRDAEAVQEAIRGREAVLLDARAPAAFHAGHLPTARSFFLQETLRGDDVKTWKSSADLRVLAAAAGADGSRPIITYCTSGRESAQIWFSLRHVAGFEEVSSYHGSWIDWTAQGLPVEK